MRSMTWFAAAFVLGAALVAAPPDSFGQTAPVAQPAPSAQPAQPAVPAAFSAEQLEQLVAPIALYPDSLLTQALMAATYPLEIVEAARWLQKNPSLKDTALTEALKGEDWDPSVKSVCGFPEVLKQLNDNLDWMQDLGDAFLAQQQELMQAVQRMRAQAYASGNLKTTEQQKVTQTSEQVVIIEPANPEVIYVPTYSPTVVYGGWGYPSYYYPTMYLPPPPGVGFMAFTAGVAFGAAVWGHADWNNNSVNVDVNRYNNFNRNTSVNAEHYANRTGNAGQSQRPGGPPGPAGGPGGGQQSWQHNPEHRKGVNYKDSGTAQRVGGAGGSNQATRDQARGRGESKPGGGASAGTRPTGGGAGGAARPSAGAGASAGTRDVPRQVSGSSGGSAQRPTSSVGSSSSGGSRNSAYSGSRSPSSSASSSSRGASSRGSSSYSGSASSGGSRSSSGGGGGSRGGGGGGGGRGGGGGGRR